MSLFFLLLLLPLKLTSGYHDSDIFAGDRYYNDDEYMSDEYDFYNDGSGDNELFQAKSIENLRRDLFTNYSRNTRP